MDIIDLFWTYLLIINAAGFILMLVDKIKAKNHAWRIPEKVLLLTAVVGGSLGVLVSMELFHHKTKHMKFRLGVPAILLAQAIALVVAQQL